MIFYKGQVGVIVNNQIAVLIPCYNEEQTVCEVVSAFRNHLPAAAVYVYDNNSMDYWWYFIHSKYGRVVMYFEANSTSSL